MEKRAFGKTGMMTSVLGFGSSEIGFSQTEQKVVDRILNEALDTGLNVIDTAECYKEAEASIGKAVSHRRNDYFLFTKCGHGFGQEMGLPDWHPDLLAASIDNSLRRLKTDTIDLIQLHSCDKTVLAQGDAISVLQRAREQGKVRFIGYSGDSDNAVYAIELGVFDALQTSINVADQESIDRLLPLAQERQMGVIAKRPVANVAWQSGAVPPANPYATPYWERMHALAYPFLASSLQESVNTALRFTLSQPGVCTAIVGTQNPDRWIQNSAAVALGPLPPSEIKGIRDRWHQVSTGWIGLG